MISSLLPERSAAMISAAMLRAVARNAASCVACSRAASDCFRWAPTRSFDSWLTRHRQGCEFASLVMIALTQRKRTRLMRNVGSGFNQNALGDPNHVGRRNIPHAAMVG